MPNLQTWMPEKLLRRRRAECWPALLCQWVQAQQEAYIFTDLLQDAEDLLRQQDGEEYQDLMEDIGAAIARHAQTFTRHLLRDLLRDRHVEELMANPNLPQVELIQEVGRMVDILVGERLGTQHDSRKNLIALLDTGWKLPEEFQQKLLEPIQRDTPHPERNDTLWRPEAAHRRRQRSAYEVLQHSANLTASQLQILYERMGKQSAADTVKLLEHPAADEALIAQVLDDVREGAVEWEYLGPLMEQILEHPVAQNMPRARNLVRERGTGHLLWELLEIAEQPGERGKIVLRLLERQPQAVLGELKSGEQLSRQLRASDGAVLLGRTEGDMQQKLLRLLGQQGLTATPEERQTTDTTTPAGR